MISLELLFEETKNIEKEFSVDKIQKLNNSLADLALHANDIPILHPPKEGSPDHLEELEIVKESIVNPTFSAKFLNISDKKPEEIFQKYVKEASLDVDTDKISDLCNQFDKVVLLLKNYYNRPRPKESFKVYDDTFSAHNIRKNKSSAYPSGHTAMAYFIANIIGRENPDQLSELETLAAMIGQSRIDNGVHYPSDVSFGRYLGELAAQSTEAEVSLKKDFKKLNKRQVCDMFKEKWERDPNYLYDLAEFISRSNEIERYMLDSDSCVTAAEYFLRGFPVDDCTQNKFIRSHLSALRCSATFKKIDSLDKIIDIHKSLGDDVIESTAGSAGDLRNFKHRSRSGVSYPDPYDITSYIENYLELRKSPFERHGFYEWVHPFCDGNGRSGRILLAKDLDYNFNEILPLIGARYLPMIIKITGELADEHL